MEDGDAGASVCGGSSRVHKGPCFPDSVACPGPDQPYSAPSGAGPNGAGANADPLARNLKEAPR